MGNNPISQSCHYVQSQQIYQPTQSTELKATFQYINCKEHFQQTPEEDTDSILIFEDNHTNILQNINKKRQSQIYVKNYKKNKNVITEKQQKFTSPKKYKNIENIPVKWNSYIQIKNQDIHSQYTILHKIGVGTVGKVYKAISRRLKIFRAIKVIDQQSIQIQSDLHKIYQEVILMSVLDHPNIIKIHEAYNFDNQIFIVMQLCQGGSLASTLKYQLSQAHLNYYVKQMLSALNYLHKLGFMHRDIKLENILIDDKQNDLIKIIDFGLACKANQQDNLRDRLGTPLYMAPEVVNRNYNNKADIWSLGITILILVNHESPYSQQSTQQLYRQIVKGKILLNKKQILDKSNQFQDFLKKILNVNSGQRMSAEQCLKHPWIQKFKKKTSDNFFRVVKVTNKKNKRNKKILKRMQKFKFKNRVQAIALTFIVSQILTNQQKRSKLKCFRDFDINNDGLLSYHEVTQAMELHLPNYSKQATKQMLNYIDFNKNKAIDYTQFLVSTFNLSSLSEEYIMKAFDFLDKNQNGYITLEDIFYFIDYSMEGMKELQQLFELIDEDKDGKINRQQFMTVFRIVL